MIYLTRRATFSASHYYWNPAWTAEKNRQVFGRCANKNGHGHNYTLEVTVAGEPDSVTGFVGDGRRDSDNGESGHCRLEAAGAVCEWRGRGVVEQGARLRNAGDLCGISGRSMKAYFGRRYTISASHRLHAEGLSAEENRAIYGKCNNPHGHGHNYMVEVLVGGEVAPETGMVINLTELDEVVRARVVDRFDHSNLNLDPLFVNRVPTTENLCRVVFGLLKNVLPTGKLERVRVEETENNFFECEGE